MTRSRLIYLIFAALLLFSGYDRALAGAQHDTVIAPLVQDFQHKNISTSNKDQEDGAFLPDTVWDDDDENYMPDRKKASFHEFFSLLASVSLFDCGAPTVINSSHFSENYSHSFPARYIFQRVLRIWFACSICISLPGINDAYFFTTFFIIASVAVSGLNRYYSGNPAETLFRI